MDDRVSKEYIEELDRSEQKIKEFNQSLKITKLRIENSIAMMENPKESKVLRMHYLEGIPWKCVALELDNKEVTIFGIRKMALSNLVV